MIKIKREYFIYYIYFFIFITPLNTFKSQLFITTTLLLIGWIITFKKNEYTKELKGFFSFTPFLLIILFFLYNCFSFFWSSSVENWLNIQSLFKYYLIIIPVLATTLTAQEAKNSFKFFLLSISFYALFSILIYLGLLEITKTLSNPIGTLAYSIATPYMVIGFFSSLILSFYEKNIKIKYLFYLIAIIFFIAVFIHNGRAGQLAFFGTLFTFIIIYRKKVLNVKNFIILIVIMSVSFSTIHLFKKDERFLKGFNEVENLINKGEFKGSWGERAYVWSGAIEGIKNNPIFGVGAGGNTDYIVSFHKKNNLYSEILATHNLHLDILFKYGMFGYAIFLSSIVLLLVSLFKTQEKLFGLLGITFYSTMFFTSLGDDILIIKPFNNVFINIFMLLSIIVIKKDQKIKP